MDRQDRSKERHHRTARGFVLTELMVALGIFMLLSAAVINVYLMSIRTWREGSAQVALQRKLAAAVQRIVQGDRSQAEARQHGLREAEAITVVDEHTIDFTSGVDGTTRRFYLNGNEIVYDPDTSVNGDDEQTIYDPSRAQSADDTSTYRTDLQFVQVGDGTIEIRLTGEERVLDRWMNAALVTRVAPRN
jgi:type II secretory pathway pseudopilin PulG